MRAGERVRQQERQRSETDVQRLCVGKRQERYEREERRKKRVMEGYKETERKTDR